MYGGGCSEYAGGGEFGGESNGKQHCTCKCKLTTFNACEYFYDSPSTQGENLEHIKSQVTRLSPQDKYEII